MKIDNDAMNEVVADIGRKIVAADESLRMSFAGLDVEDIVPEVESSMAALGLDLSDSKIRDYAQHIADRADYEFVLQ
ncbi:hypothetical protein [Aeromicrobium sp.]|uniref:hypothetical protein n=1 Tax=Aeromicrobium sp. TaxID=1871063 RepID=UPI003C633BB1